jgi:hypothetical protein
VSVITKQRFLIGARQTPRMSALGHQRKFYAVDLMSALPAKAAFKLCDIVDATIKGHISPASISSKENE